MSRFGQGVDSPKMYVTALVFCLKADESEEGSPTGISRIFDQLVVTACPTQFPKFFLYVALDRGTSDEKEFFVAIYAPNGETIAKAKYGITEWADQTSANFIIPIAKLRLPSDGLYVVQLFVADRVLIERYLDVKIQPQPPAARAG